MSEKTKEQECLEKLNAVLEEFQFSLMPTFRLVPVPKPEPETADKPEEKEPETNDEGTD